MSARAAWPELPVAAWQPTRDTFTLWLQIVGKVRIARAPLLNHWWNAPLYLTSRGLTTSLVPAGAGRSFSIDLDLLERASQAVLLACSAARASHNAGSWRW